MSFLEDGYNEAKAKSNFKEAIRKKREERIKRLRENPTITVTLTPKLMAHVHKMMKKKGIRDSGTYVREALGLLVVLDEITDNDDVKVDIISSGTEPNPSAWEEFKTLFSKKVKDRGIKISGPFRAIVGRRRTTNESSC